MKTVTTVLLFVAFANQAEAQKERLSDVFATHKRAPGADATLRNGVIGLTNRGIAVTKRAYPNGVEFAGYWMWTEGRGTYCDHLCIAFRTDGSQRDWAHEIVEGIVVRYNPSGQVSIDVLRDGKMKALALAKATFKKRTWHYVGVRDNGKTVSVWINQKQDKPTLRVKIPDGLKHSKLALYNREVVAGVTKKSILKWVIVRAKSSPGVACPLQR